MAPILLFLNRTSKKPEMKFLGNLAFSSSSTLKYFITCVLCFQKFSVSYRASRSVMMSCGWLIEVPSLETRHGSGQEAHQLLAGCLHIYASRILV